MVEHWTISLDLEILLHYALVMILVLSPTGHGSPPDSDLSPLGPQVLLGSAIALSHSSTIYTQYGRLQYNLVAQ